MAEENKQKDIISILNERMDDAIAIGDGSTAKAIQMRIKYLNSLDDPEDIKRLTKKSDEFRSFVRGVTKYSDQEKDAENVLAGAMPTRVERDEKTAKKTIDEKGLLSIVPNNGSVEEIYDPESDYSWYKWTPTQGKAYAKAAGMAYGDFLKKIAEMDTQNQRKRIANDGAFGLATSVFLPRIHKDIERDGNVSPASVALDLAENVAQAVPVGRVLGSLPKIGKAYKAANGTVAKIGKNIGENALVPSTFAMTDTDRDLNERIGNSILGTSVNIATPRIIKIGLQRFGAGEISSKISKALDNGSPLATYAINKLGKDKYGQRGLNMVANFDPTGIVSNALADKEEKLKVNSEQQKALDKQHTKNIVDEYNAKFGVK